MSTDSPHGAVPHVLRESEPSRDTDSIARRISRLEFGTRRCVYVSAGFGGIVLLLGSGEILGGLDVLVAAIVTLVVLGVFCIAMAYVAFLRESSRLSAKLIEGRDETEPAGQYDPRPHHWYVAGSLALMLNGAALVVGVWVAAFA
ncbi:hypothetical protein [Agromyces bracchium]|uniref:Uncharacterized protein n=1 Tax=Agromyces bracchium TaxID=88376 RepID=A0A6I3M1Q8_9MICO|nr:hypothetical protein [Agromyces bracchium]MTH67419.1 hypothetical protein [Agromyces bracchium]